MTKRQEETKRNQMIRNGSLCLRPDFKKTEAERDNPLGIQI